MVIILSMLTLATFLITFFVDIIWATGAPEVSLDESQRIVFAHLGTIAILRCPIKNPRSDGFLFVDWKRGDETLYNTEGYRITDKGMLRIRQIKIKDEGLFTCHATNGFGSVLVNVSLIVYRPSSEVEIDGNNNQSIADSKPSARIFRAPKIEQPNSLAYTAEVGSTLTLKCAASGRPYPAIFWLKNGDLQQGTNGRSGPQEKWTSFLTIRQIKLSDAAVYTCYAKNEFGTDQLSFSVHVRDAESPPIISSLEPSEKSVSVGDTAVFWCRVKNNSGLKLLIKWLKGVTDEEIQWLNRTFRVGDNYYKPLKGEDAGVSSGSGSGYSSKLVISNTKPQDSGTYLCLAVNDKGFTVRNATLSVMTQPGSKKYLSVPSVTAPDSYYVSIVVSVVVIIIAVVSFLIVYRYNCRRSMGTEEVPKRQEGLPLNYKTSLKYDDKQQCKNLQIQSTPAMSPTVISLANSNSYYYAPPNINKDCAQKSDK